MLADLKQAGIEVCADHVRQILDVDAPDAGSSLVEALYGGQADAIVEVFAGIRRLKEAGVDIEPMTALQILSSAWGWPTEFVNVLTAAPEAMIRDVAQCLDDLGLPKAVRKDYLIAQLGDTSVSGMPQLTHAAIVNYEILFGQAADEVSANSFLDELKGDARR